MTVGRIILAPQSLWRLVTTELFKRCGDAGVCYKTLIGDGDSSTTVKPVLSGPVLNERPVLSGQMSKSRKSTPLSDNCKLYLY